MGTQICQGKAACSSNPVFLPVLGLGFRVYGLGFRVVVIERGKANYCFRRRGGGVEKKMKTTLSLGFL